MKAYFSHQLRREVFDRDGFLIAVCLAPDVLAALTVWALAYLFR